MSQRHLYIYILLAALLATLLAGCSTTAALPEDELLYTGIHEINYTDDPALLRKRKQADTTGVITALADAVTAVNEVLEGKRSVSLEDLAEGKKELSEEEKKVLKAAQAQNEADFATAKEEVEAVLAYPPNNSIFGSSKKSWPWQIGLWIHNSLYDNKGKVGRWFDKKFGTEPVLISNVSPEMRAKVATNTLHNFGYFQGSVRYDLLPQKNPKKAKINYTVHAGRLYRLDSIAYLKFPARMDSVLRLHRNDRLLKRGDAFSVVKLSEEQQRIEKILRENGYFFFQSSYTTYRADTVAVPGKVQLQVVPVAGRPARADKPWYIGRTTVNLRRNSRENLTRSRTRRGYTFNFGGDKMPIRAGMWRHAITHREGELYHTSDQKMTLEKIGEMGILSQMDINYVPRDTTEQCDTLDLFVTAVMDKLYDSTFEVNATMKSNQQVGPGISYELAKRNAFRGGEKVAFKIYGSYEWQTGTDRDGSNSLLNSYELGGQLSFRFPRFVFPGISRRRMRFHSSTEFALDANWKNRSNFYNVVSMSARAKYDWYRKETAQHSLTLFDLEFNKLNHTTPAFDSIMNANPALYVSMRDQFIPSVSYTFTYQSPSKRRHPLWAQLTFKQAGLLTSAGYAIAGQPFNRKGKLFLGNPFAQYVKFAGEVHKTYKLSPSIRLATRFFGGIIYSYGNSSTAPYYDQFYVGGANSIRAFTVRSIGPGRFRPTNTRYAYIDQTGDIKLEANAELRVRLFGDLHGAIFLDAGNVWTLRDELYRPGGRLTASTIKDIALGTGAGLRYDLQFLVLRLDLGIGLHAPYKTSKSGFYNIERFKDGLGIHLAIGYPF